MTCLEITGDLLDIVSGSRCPKAPLLIYVIHEPIRPTSPSSNGRAILYYNSLSYVPQNPALNALPMHHGNF